MEPPELGVSLNYYPAMDVTQGLDPEVTFEVTEFDSPSSAVVTAVAEESGDDFLALAPLNEAVDPDSLDRVFAPTNASRDTRNGSIGFEYQDYWVVVEANGRGYLYEQDEVRLSAAGVTAGENDE